MIRLIATDLDGTLLSPGGHEMTDRNRQALLTAAERGIHVVIATGRVHSSGAPFAREIPGDLPVISCNGAMVRLSRSGQELMRLGVEPDVTKRLLPRLRSEGMKPWFFSGDLCLAEEDDQGLRALVERTGVKVQFVPSLDDAASCRPEKILGVLPPERTAALQQQLSEDFASELYVTRSSAEQLDILNPQATKGRALTFVARHLGVPQEEVMALGDNLNDLALFDAAGLKVAMGNADEALKGQAHWITGTNEESGVAQAIERALALQPL